MPVSDMRALRTLCFNKHLRNLSTQRLPSPPTTVSCKSSQNPKFSRQFRYSPRRTFHSTNHRPRKESDAEEDVSTGWNSSTSWSNHAGPRNERNPSVSTFYDPVSGRLVTRRGLKANNDDQESESSNGGENHPSPSSLDQEDVWKGRTYGSVRRENVIGGSEQGLGLGEIVGSKKKGKSKVSWVCSNCGHSEGQWWGTCRACDRVGTITRFVEGQVGGGKVSGFEVSENVARSWLPQHSSEAVPLRLTDVNRGINQLDWRIPL